MGPIDGKLAGIGCARTISTVVGGFTTALSLARSSDLIATVPECHSAALRQGMHTFRLPFDTDEISVALMWHPRLDADAGHRWLRQCVREVCAAEAAAIRGA